MKYYQSYDILGQMRKGARAFSLLVNTAGEVMDGNEQSQGALSTILSTFWSNLENCYTNDPYTSHRQNNEFLVLFIEFMQVTANKESDSQTWIQKVNDEINKVTGAQFVTSLSNSTTIADLRNKLVIFVNYQGQNYPTGYDPSKITKYIVLNKVYSDETENSECKSTYYDLNDRDITNIYRFVPEGAGFTNGSSVNVWKQNLQRLEPAPSNTSIWTDNTRTATKIDKAKRMIEQAVLQYDDKESGQWNINNLGCFRVVNDPDSYNSNRGISGNTVTAANAINEPIYNYLANDENRTGPLGVMQMNFFGEEKLKDYNKGELNIYGVLLPQIIIENNFRFPLKTKGSSESTTSLRYDATFK